MKVTFHQKKFLPKSASRGTRKQQNCPSASKRTGSNKFPTCLQKNRKQQNSPCASKRTGSIKIPHVPPKEQEATKFPHVCLSPSIHSRLVGSAGPMSPPTKNVLLWIGSPGAMATANTTTRLAAMTCRLGLVIDRS
jgi:hypothetical protein